jgi:hypothetical protein
MNQNLGGTDKMKAAMERLDAEGVRYKQTTAFQLKVGPYNFYPDTGRIYADREPKSRAERGLEHFLTIVRKLRDGNPRTFRRSPANSNKDGPEASTCVMQSNHPHDPPPTPPPEPTST